MKLLCCTVSKALINSMYMKSIFPLCCSIYVQTASTINGWSTVDFLAKKILIVVANSFFHMFNNGMLQYIFHRISYYAGKAYSSIISWVSFWSFLKYWCDVRIFPCRLYKHMVRTSPFSLSFVVIFDMFPSEPFKSAIPVLAVRFELIHFQNCFNDDGTTFQRERTMSPSTSHIFHWRG